MGEASASSSSDRSEQRSERADLDGREGEMGGVEMEAVGRWADGERGGAEEGGEQRAAASGSDSTTP